MAKKMFPLYDQLKDYNLQAFLNDLRGALTVSVVLLPSSIGFASLARGDTVQALVSAVFPLLFYAIFGGSPCLSIGPEVMVAVIIGSAVDREYNANPSLYDSPSQIATTLSLVVGLLCVVLALLRGGFLDHILSGYLLTGFILGVTTLVMVDQAPNMLGMDVKLNAGVRLDTTTIPSTTSQHPYDILEKYINLNIEHCVYITNENLEAKSKGKVCSFDYVPVLGMFNDAIPRPAVPYLDGGLLYRLVEPALLIVLVGYIECQTVTRNFGLRKSQNPGSSTELFAFGMMNLLSSFLGSFPTFGSLPRSRTMATIGVQTTLSGVMIAALVLIMFTSLRIVLQYLPTATLASIVTVSAYGLIDVQEIWFVFKLRSIPEIGMFLSTFIITLVTSMSTGILLCLGLSALFIVRKTTTSTLSVMGRALHNDSRALRQVKLSTGIIDHPRELGTLERNGSDGVLVAEDFGAGNSSSTILPKGSFEIPRIEIGSHDQQQHDVELTTQVPLNDLSDRPNTYLKRPPSVSSLYSVLTDNGGDHMPSSTPQPSTQAKHHHHIHIRSSRPTTPHSRFLSVIDCPDVELLEGVIILRIDVPLLFYNCGQLRRCIENLMRVEEGVVFARRRRWSREVERRGGDVGDGKVDEGGGASLDIEDDVRGLDRLGGRGPSAWYESEWESNSGKCFTVRNDDDDEVSDGCRGDDEKNDDFVSTDGEFSERDDKRKKGKVRSRSRASSINDVAMGRLSGIGNWRQGRKEKKLKKRKKAVVGIHTIILDFVRVFDQDSAATLILKRTLETFQTRGIRVLFCGVHDFQLEMFKRAGMQDLLKGNVFDTLNEAVMYVEGEVVGLDEVAWYRAHRVSEQP
ncbi:Solute carrier 26 [Blyttiomyces sp. JEL0837]|nr:Solute carrier 26 [Blyttiomyces sp. JEL0837]